ncbi:MAG: MBL fold metallo-hydrolase [Candidatus Micrarchaeaceae archaeon]
MITAAGCTISLDSREQADFFFVSHAHSDHIAGVHKGSKIVASPETIELISATYGIESKKNDDFSEKCNASMLDAGHMLGSKQLFIEDLQEGKAIVYTGDFQMEKSRTVKPIEIKEADVAIVDSTYPYPEVIFEEKSKVEESIAKWTSKAMEKGIVLFGAYKMGKAQELISILNSNGIMPWVSKGILNINKVYEKNGIRLNYLSTYKDDSLEGGNFVGISESRDIRQLGHMLEKIHGKRVYTAVVTGFAKTMHFGTDMQFALSDHADFKQTVEYINDVHAKEIVAYGKNSKIMAANLARMGINATPFDR